jgi:ribosomal protein S18 acetylase RimI-like enzyme
MAAHDHLGAQFVFHAANPKSMGGISTHTVEAWAPEHVETPWAQAHPSERMGYEGSSIDPGLRPMASMSWHHQTGEVKGVYTVPEHQRQGLATSLWHEGHRLSEQRGVPAPKHSTFRTNSGDPWARSVGGRLPKRSKG